MCNVCNKFEYFKLNLYFKVLVVMYFFEFDLIF